MQIIQIWEVLGIDPVCLSHLLSPPLSKTFFLDFKTIVVYRTPNYHQVYWWYFLKAANVTCHLLPLFICLEIYIVLEEIIEIPFYLHKLNLLWYLCGRSRFISMQPSVCCYAWCMKHYPGQSWVSWELGRDLNHWHIETSLHQKQNLDLNLILTRGIWVIFLIWWSQEIKSINGWAPLLKS